MRYRFGRSVVCTTIALPSLQQVPGSAALGTIHVDLFDKDIPSAITWDHHWQDGKEVVLSLAKFGSDYWLRSPGIADFAIGMEPCRIRVAPGPSIDSSTLEHMLVDQVLPRVLAQQGELMVHASALTIDGHHALFTAPSGWGKSTLAGLLHSHGHTVLSDDCVQLAIDDGRAQATPTYPSLRLYADSLGALFPEQQTTTPVAAYSTKRRVPMNASGAPERSLPVDAIYLLGDPEEAGQTVRISPLRPAEACLALIRHSFRLDLRDRDASAAQLARCSEVARNVPAFRLEYPRDFSQRRELVGKLTQHLAALPRLS